MHTHDKSLTKLPVPFIPKIPVNQKWYNYIQIILMWSPPFYVEACFQAHTWQPSQVEVFMTWTKEHSADFSNFFAIKD